jgi:hypothetical protein
MGRAGLSPEGDPKARVFSEIVDVVAAEVIEPWGRQMAYGNLPSVNPEPVTERESNV